MNADWAGVRSRIKCKCKADEHGCWIWQGSLDCSGYARISFRMRNWRASQITWAAHNETEWPVGMHALHSCDNRRCVNPIHIRPGTNAENIREAYERGGLLERRRKSACPRGHAMVPENVVLFPSTGRLRHCRICIKEKSIISNARAKQRRAEKRIAR